MIDYLCYKFIKIIIQSKSLFIRLPPFQITSDTFYKIGKHDNHRPPIYVLSKYFSSDDNSMGIVVYKHVIILINNLSRCVKILKNYDVFIV